MDRGRLALSTFAAILAVGFVSSASAGLVTFTDVVNGPIRFVEDTDFHYRHNLLDNGPGSLNLATDTIQDAVLAIALRDDGGNEEVKVRFNLGKFTTFAENVPDTGRTFTFDLGTLSGNLIAWLQQDGTLDVTLRVDEHGTGDADVIFASSTMTGTADRVDLPEPTSMALLAGGVVAVRFARRRLRG